MPASPSEPSSLAFETPDGPSFENDLPVGTRVRLVHTFNDIAETASGGVVRLDGALVRFQLQCPPPFEVGMRLLAETPTARHLVLVTEIDGRTMSARILAGATRDRREYPRLRVSLAVHYRSARSAADAVAWLKGAPLDEAVRAPAGVDFSATGLAFDDDVPTRVGERLLVDLQVPGHRRPWRLTARVVRCFPVSGSRHRTAVAFEHIPTGATLALVGYTLRVRAQDMGDEPIFGSSELDG